LVSLIGCIIFDEIGISSVNKSKAKIRNPRPRFCDVSSDLLKPLRTRLWEEEGCREHSGDSLNSTAHILWIYHRDGRRDRLSIRNTGGTMYFDPVKI